MKYSDQCQVHVLSKVPCRRLVDFVLVWEEKPKVKKEKNISLLIGDYTTRTSTVGRGDFQKKSQKVPAFWKMAAVTFIRLLVYIGIPPCTALTCRRRTEGVENMK